MQYIVGNRSFFTYEQAMQYCIDVDFDFHTMIQILPDNSENKLYWYEYRLRGFSLGCQPKGHIEVDHSKGKYGIIAYNRALTNSEINEYELKIWEEIL